MKVHMLRSGQGIREIGTYLKQSWGWGTRKRIQLTTPVILFLIWKIIEIFLCATLKQKVIILETFWSIFHF